MIARKPVSPGTCQYCQCTDAQEHRIAPTGEPCSWGDNTRTWCNAPACVKKHAAAVEFACEYSKRMEAERREQLLSMRRSPRRRPAARSRKGRAA